MYNHAPADYKCPFCRLVQGDEGGASSRIVYRDDAIVAFISKHKWPNNPGHVLVVPNQHFENIYDLPLHLGTRIHECAKAIALAMKAAYQCDGISTRQHNEPAGNQDVWHYHLHVFPRYKGDQLYASHRERATQEEQVAYARKLRAHLRGWQPETRQRTSGLVTES